MDQRVGIIARQKTQVGTDYLYLDVVVENEEGEIRNPGTYVEDGPDFLADLHIHGHYSDICGAPCLVGFKKPEYERLYFPLNEMERGIKTLRKIHKRIEKDAAREPGDVFFSFAQAIKADFFILWHDTFPSSYSENEYYKQTIQEGRNALRHMVEKKLEQMREAKSAA